MNSKPGDSVTNDGDGNMPRASGSMTTSDVVTKWTKNKLRHQGKESA